MSSTNPIWDPSSVSSFSTDPENLPKANNLLQENDVIKDLWLMNHPQSKAGWNNLGRPENFGTADAGFPFDWDSGYSSTFRYGQDYQEAHKQLHESGFLNQLNRGVLRPAFRLLNSVATKILQGGSFLGALPFEAVHNLGEDNYLSSVINDAADNFFAEALGEWEKMSNERGLYIASTEKFDSLDLLSKIKSFDASFWGTEAMDTLAFTLSSFVPAGLMSKARLGTKMLAGLAKNKKIANALHLMRKSDKGLLEIAPNIAKIAKNIDFGTTVATSSFIEAMFESKDMKDSIMNDPILKTKYSPEELEKLAGQAASNTFGMNMLTLLLTNSVEVGTLFNKNIFGKAERASRKKVASAFGTKIGEDAAGKLVVENAKGVNKFLANPSIRALGKLGANIVAEGGIEENAQWMIQAANAIPLMNDNPNMAGAWGELWNMATNVLDTETYRGEKERLGSMFMGSLIGMGSTTLGVTGAGKIIGLPSENIWAESKKFKQRQQELVDDINSGEADLTKMDIFDKDPDVQIKAAIEDGQYIIYRNGEKLPPTTKEEYDDWRERAEITQDQGEGVIRGGISFENGKPKLNLQKLGQKLGDLRKTVILSEIYDALHTDEEKNQVAINFIRNEMLAHLALKYFKAGYGDLLLERLKVAKDVSEEELIALGLTRNGMSEEDLNQRIAYVEELERLYNDVNESVVTTKNKYKPIARDRVTYLFDRGQRILAIDYMAQNLVNNTVQTIFKDLGDLYRQGLERATSEESKGRYDRMLNKISRLMRYMDSYSAVRPNGEPHRAEGLANVLEGEIKEFMAALEDDTLIKKNPANQRDFYRAMKQLIAVQQVLETRGELYSDWFKVSDFASGEQYFMDNYSELMNPKTELIKLLILTDQTTKGQYTAYEDDMVFRLKIQNELNLAEERYHGVAWREYMKREDASIRGLVDFLVKNNALLDKEDLNEIIDIIQETYDLAEELSTRIKFLEKEKREYEEDIKLLGAADSVEEQAEVARIDQELSQLYPAMEGIEQNLGTTDVKAQDVIDHLTQHQKNYSRVTNIDLLRVHVMDEFLAGFRQLEKVFEVNENFDDLGFVEGVLSTLRNLLRLNENRTDSITNANKFGKAYDKKIQEIKNAIAEAEKIKKVVETRLNARLREDKLNNKKSVEQFYKTFGISKGKIKPSHRELLYAFLPKSKVDEILAAISKQEVIKQYITKDEFIEVLDVAPFYAILHLLQNLPSEKRKEFTDFLRNMNINSENRINRIRKAASNTTRKLDQIPQVAFIFNLLEQGNDSTRKLFNDLLYFLSDNEKPESFDRAEPNSSVAKYLNDQKLFKFQEAALNQTRPENAFLTAPSLQTIIEQFIPIIFTNDTIDAILYGESKLFSLTDKKNLLKINKGRAENNTKALFAPTNEQSNVIDSILSNIYKILGKENSDLFEDFIYLKGPAGSGKTNVVIRWVLEMLPQFKKKNILAAGHNEHSARTLHSSINPTNPALTIDELIAKVNEGISEDIDLIILDEIGNVSSAQLRDLAQALKKRNDARRAAGKKSIPLIVMGDPNQRVKGTSGKPAIELTLKVPNPNLENNLDGIHRMNIVPSLTITFRSDNPSVVMLQKMFEGSTAVVDGLQGRANFRMGELVSVQEPLQGSYVDNTTGDLLTLLGKAIETNPEEQKAIIVSNEKDQESWKKKLADKFPTQASSGLVEVLTIEEAQGRTIPEVFVDIAMPVEGMTKEQKRIVNSDIYTATSRAVNFVYLGNVPGAKNDLDNSLEEKTKDNKQQKIDAFDEAIEEIDRILAALEGFGLKVTTQPVVEEDKEDEPKPPTPPNPEDPTGPKDPNEDEKGAQSDGQRERTVEEDNTDTVNNEEDEVEDTATTGDEESDTDTYEEDEASEENPEYDSQIITLAEPEGGVFRPMSAQDILYYKGLEADLEEREGNLNAKLVTLDNQSGRATRTALVVPGEEEGTHVIVAVFTKEEMERLGMNYDAIPKSMYSTVAPELKGVVQLESDITDNPELTISKQSSRLKYIYVANPEMHQSLDDAMGLVHRWANSMSDGAQAPIDLSNVELRIRVFTDKTARDVEAETRSFTPKTGYPYLEIRNWRREGAVKYSKPQYIRLRNKHLNELTEEERNFHTGLIQEFAETVMEAEKVLDEDFNMGAIKLGTRAFTKLAYHLVDLGYIVRDGAPFNNNKVPGMGDENFGFLFKMFGPRLIMDIKEGKFDKLLDILNVIDEAVHGPIKNKDDQWRKKRLHQGKAQRQFDKLAKANMYTISDDGRVIMIRDERTFYKPNSKDGDVKIVGRSLLGFRTNARKSKYSDRMTEYQENHFERLRERKRRNPSTLTTREAIALAHLEAYGKGNVLTGNRNFFSRVDRNGNRLKDQTILSSQDLMYMILSPMEQEGMRAPISVKMWDGALIEGGSVHVGKQMIPSGSILKHGFAGVRNQAVRVHIPNLPVSNTVPENPKTPETPHTPTPGSPRSAEDPLARRDRMRRNRGPKLASKSEVQDPGPAISIKEAEKMYRKYIPESFWQTAKRWLFNLVGAKHEKLAFEVLDAAEMELRAGKPAWGLYLNGTIYLEEAAPGKVYRNILAHEIFHKYFHQHIDVTEREMAYQWAINEDPSLKYQSHEKIEEYLATRFQEWKGTNRDIGSVMPAIFSRILKAIGFLRTYSRDIEDLFTRMGRGYYRSQLYPAPNIKLTSEVLQKLFGDVPTYSAAKEMLMEYVGDFMQGKTITDADLFDRTNGEEGYIYTPRTFEEALSAAWMEINNYRQVLKEIKNGYSYIENGRTVQVPKRELSEAQKVDYSAAHSLTGTNKKAFSVLVSNLYPDANLEEIYTNLDIPIKEMDEEEKSQAGLWDQIQEAEDKDPMSNVIKTVKQMFSLIGYNTANGYQYVPFEQTYAILLKVLDRFDTTVHPNEMYNHIIKYMSELNNSSEGKAIIKFIKELTKHIANDDKMPYVSFYSDDVVILDTTGNRDARFLDPTSENTDIIIFRRGTEENLTDFFNRTLQQIRTEGVEITNKQWEEKHRAFKATNLWNNMVVSFRSMREKRPMVGIARFKKGGVKEHRYIENRMSGVRPIFASTIQDRLREKLEEEERHIAESNADPSDNWFKKWRKSLPRNNSEISHPKGKLGFKREKIKEFIEKILSKAEARRFTNDIPDRKVADIYVALRGVLGAMSSWIEQEGSYAETTVEAFMAENTGFADQLAASLFMLDTDYSSPNYIRADGKRGYAHQFSSFAMEIFKKAEEGVLSSLSFMKNPVMAANLFNTKDLTFYRYVDHDGTRLEGLPNSAKLYRKENTAQWYTRSFIDQFLGRLTLPNVSNKYVQSVNPISDKPNIVGAEVGYIDINNDKELNDILTKLVEQERLIEKELRTKQFDTNVNHQSSLLPVYKGRSVKVGEVTVEMLREEIEEKSKEFLEAIAKSGVGESTNLWAFYKKYGFKKAQGSDSMIEQSVKSKFSEELAQKSQMSADEVQHLEREMEAYRKQIRKGGESPTYIEEIYREAARAFVYNYFINSHQLNQLFTGPVQYYKNIYDVIKRMSILFGPGRVGNVNSKLGLPVKSRMMVINDFEEHSQLWPGLPDHLVGKDFESTDAQGYVTPEYWARLKKSFGIESEVDTILKPVYAGIGEDGIPRGVKYSLVVLTDKLVNDPQFAQLKKVRDMMTANNIDQAVFGSAVKMGAPLKNDRIQLDDKGFITSFKESSVFEIDNRNLRLQFNPAHDSITNVTNPSQLTYFPIISEQSAEDHDKLLRLNSELIDLGNDVVDRMLNLENGNPVKGGRRPTSSAIRDLAKKTWEGLAGSENLWRLVSNAAIDLNLPIIANKVMSTLASSVTKKTVDFKLRGSKLYLVSEFSTYTDETERLQWRDENGFTEVMINQDIADHYGLKEGSAFSFEDYRAFGFRLPSTGLHSALVFKVKKIIPTPPNMKNNIIIAPAHIVFNHGSDYDIDSLFVISPKKVSEITGGTDFNLGTLLNKIDDRFNSDLVLSANSLLNYSSKGTLLKFDKWGNPYNEIPGAIDTPQSLRGDEYTLDQVLGHAYDSLKAEISELKWKKRKGKLTEKDNLRLDELIGSVGFKTTSPTKAASYFSGLEQTLVVLRQNSIKNNIGQTFIDILTDPANRKWMELPIVMERLKQESPEGVEKSPLDIVAEIKKPGYKNRDEVLFPSKNLNSPVTQQTIHRNTFSGDSLRGASANVVKVIANLFKAARGENPKVKENLSLKLNGHTWDSFNRTEKVIVEGKDKDGQTVTSLEDYRAVVGFKNGKPIYHVHSIWETLDALINAAIDNVKEQILYHLNLTDDTSNEFFAMLAFGVPVQDVTRFFQSPAIVTGLEEGTLRKEKLNELRSQFYDIIVDKLYNENYYTPNKEGLEKYRKLTKEQKQAKKEGKEVELPELTQEEWKALIRESVQKELAEDNLIGLTSDNLTKAAITFNTAITENESSSMKVQPLRKLSIEDLKVQLVVLKEFGKLQSIGEALFASSRALQILRVLPSEYSDGKNVQNEIKEKVGEFGYNENQFDKEVREFINNFTSTEEFQALEKEQQEEALNLALLEKYAPETRSSVFSLEDVKGKKARTATNKILRGKMENDDIVDADDWPFTNTNLLSLPHFKQALRSLTKLLNVIEKTFIQHSRTINFYANQLAGKLQKTYYGADNVENTKDKIKKSLMHYFVTSLDLEFSGPNGTSVLTLNDIPLEQSEHVRDPDGKKRTGYKEWVYQMRKDILAARARLNNPFLNALELIPDRETGHYRIVFTADKVQQDLEIQKYRMAFEELSRDRALLGDESQGPLSELQITLIKYLLVNSGMDFGRTSYAGVIPEFVYEELSRQFTQFVQRNLSTSGETDTSPEINKVIENFEIQYFLNNLHDVKKLSDSRLRGGDYGGNKGRMITAEDDVYHYDLKYKFSKDNNPLYIRKGDTLYRKLIEIEEEVIKKKKVEFEKVVLYARVGSKRDITLYHAPSEMMENGFDPKYIFNGNLLLSSAGIKESDNEAVEAFDLVQYETLESPELPVEQGDIIHMHKPGDLSYTSIDAYTVISKEFTESAGKGGSKKGITKLVLRKEYKAGYSIDENSTRPETFVAKELAKKEAKENKAKTKRIGKQLFEIVQKHGTEVEKEIMNMVKKMGIFDEISAFTADLSNTEHKGSAAYVSNYAGFRVSTMVVDFDYLSKYSKKDMATTIAHEFIHALTVHGITIHDLVVQALEKRNSIASRPISLNEFIRQYNEKFGTQITMRELNASKRLIKEANDIISSIKRALAEQGKEPSFYLKYALSQPKELLAVVMSDVKIRKEIENLGIGTEGSLTFWERIMKMISDFVKSIGGEAFVKALEKEGTSSEIVSRIIDIGLQTIEMQKDAVKSDEISGGFTPLQVTSFLETDTDTQEEIDSLDRLKAVSDEAELEVVSDEEYEDSKGNRWTRLSKFFDDVFSSREKNMDWAMHKAEQDFKRQGKSKEQTYFDDETRTNYTFEERTKFYKVQIETARQVGKYVHKYIEMLLTTDILKKREMMREMFEIARAKYDSNRELTQNPIDMEYLEYLTETSKDMYGVKVPNIQHILRKSGINYDMKNPNNPTNDQLLPEFTLHSEILGFATTIDNLSRNKFGLFNILDWKTGNLLSNLGSRNIIKYGLDTGIRDNKLNRAKLEVVLRMFAVKEHAPDARFHHVSVNKLNKETLVDVHNIEVKDFLRIIENYLKATDQEAYQKAKEKGMFDASNYMGATLLNDLVPDFMVDRPLSEQREYLDNEILEMKYKHTETTIENNPRLKERLKRLVENRLELDKPKGANMSTFDPDISGFTSWFGNLKDVGNKHIRAFNKIFSRRKFSSDQRYNTLEQEHDKYYDPVWKEYLKSKGRFIPGLKTVALPLIGSFSKKDMYKFMWRRSTEAGKEGWYMNTKDTYFDENSGQEIALTEAQKNYRDWAKNKMANLYKTVMGKQAFVDEYRKYVSKATIEGKDPVLPEDFMPRIPLTFGEHVFNDRGHPFKVLRASWVRGINSFLSSHDYGEGSFRSVPLKYYHKPNSDIIINEEFSFDFERAFKLFTKSLIKKDEMDQVFALGDALKNYLRLYAKDEKGEKKYTRLIGFLDNHIITKILDTEKKTKLGNSPISWYVSEGSWGNKVLGIKPGRVEMPVDKIIHFFKTATSLIGMAAKVLSGTINGILVNGFHFIQALEGSLAKRRKGKWTPETLGELHKEDVDFTLSDWWWGITRWTVHLKDWFLGGKRNSKVWNLAKKYNYLAENYDYNVPDSSIRGSINPWMRMGNLFYFHTIFENFISLQTLSTQMKHQKFKMEDGSIKNLWELHDKEGNYIGGLRGYVKEADGTITELREPRFEEINKFKRVHELTHGSYRHEERPAIEAWALGQWLQQFKRYLAGQWKRHYRGEVADDSLGHWNLQSKFEPTFDSEGNLIQPDNMNVYEWEEAIHEGRLRLLGNLIRANFLPGQKKRKEGGFDYTKYRWSEVMANPRKRQDLLGLVATIIGITGVWALYAGMVPEEEKDTYWAWRLNKLIRDVSNGLIITDLTEPLYREPIVVIAVGHKFMGAWYDLIVRGLIFQERLKDGRMPGWHNVKKHTPIVSGVVQMQKFTEDVGLTKEIDPGTRR